MSPPKLKAYQERFVRDKLRRFVEGGLDWSVLNIGLFADMGTGKTPKETCRRSSSCQQRSSGTGKLRSTGSRHG